MHKRNKLTPPGVKTTQWKYYVLATLAGALLYSLIFYTNNLDAAIDSLYEYTYPPHQELRPGAVMPGFRTVVEDALDVYPILAFSMLGFVITNYSYFYQESKSIYTMRRLKSSWELHLRCWALPVIGAGIFMAAQGIVTLICYIVYIRSVPEGVLL